ncbi:sensor domain-containing protein [Micromonospora sp. NBC_01699]|uniref:sensor histidine kinase n=1 Tax=Micromonospora sp. NBC_01699 TaxID=2975984 RepID=UPI002E2BCDA0|nr:sensor domain-containing protein [Micromonospora sp. NBC_01699]
MRSIVGRLGRDTRYLLLTFPLALVGSVLLVTGLALGIGTAILGVVSVGIMFGTFAVARTFAQLQRRALADAVNRPLAPVRYRRHRPTANWFQRLWHPTTQLQSWLDLLHGILVLPIAVVTFSLAVAWWSIALYGLAYPLFGWILDRIPDYTDVPDLIGLGDGIGTRILFHLTVGVVAVVTLPLVLRGTTALQGGISRLLLTGLSEYEERIDDLTEGRAAAVSAEASALRRLERDIHDGPQQRLVSLAMDLSRVRRELARDPKAADASLKEAITQTRETLDELRTLSRGIAPPILTDRGLAPALAALAARAIIPVELDVTVDQRYPAAVENTVYFVVAEALANSAKHSQADRIVVSLRQDGDILLLLVADDGRGGAHVAKGHGLAGLHDRLRAVDGMLTVQSPDGGPTVIGARVPCA